MNNLKITKSAAVPFPDPNYKGFWGYLNIIINDCLYLNSIGIYVSPRFDTEEKISITWPTKKSEGGKQFFWKIEDNEELISAIKKLAEEAVVNSGYLTFETENKNGNNNTSRNTF